LIADRAVLLAGANVQHLVAGKVSPHRLTTGVAIEGSSRILYPILSNGGGGSDVATE
jgi:hypothetical protein